MQKVDKTKPLFLFKKYHQFIFAALFESLMSRIYHRKMCRKFDQKYSKYKKKVEYGIVELWSLIALLKKTIFKVKFKFKVKNCVLQISVQQFLGWNIWLLSTRPFLFLYLTVKLRREIKKCLFQPRQIYLEYFGAIKMRDKDEFSIWNIWMWIKWETKFWNFFWPLSIRLKPIVHCFTFSLYVRPCEDGEEFFREE